jgi:hypothetical protein
MDTILALTALPTRKEGIFVMPLSRITILSSYWYILGRPEPRLSLPGDRDDSTSESCPL